MPLDKVENLMILEVADIRLQPGRQTEFDEAIVRGLEQVISKAAGFKSWKVNKRRRILEPLPAHDRMGNARTPHCSVPPIAGLSTMARHCRPVLRGTSGRRTFQTLR